jgi:S-formylglutathione hydrolase FrmB
MAIHGSDARPLLEVEALHEPGELRDMFSDVPAGLEHSEITRRLKIDMHLIRGSGGFVSRIAIALLLTLFTTQAFGATALRFEVTLAEGLGSQSQTGRLIVVLSRKEKPEPRFVITQAGVNGPFLLARDVKDWKAGAVITIEQGAASFPRASIFELPDGDYYAQALLYCKSDVRSLTAPGNLYSDVRKVRVNPQEPGAIQLELNHLIPPEQMPVDTEWVKFFKIQSRLLSDFHVHPIYLRAGVVLPRDYNQNPARTYPLWVRIGGDGSRFTSVAGLMNEKSDFRKTWLAKDTPQMIVLELDGAGPYGDCYQVNSANSGPYGDAIVEELIPYIEKQVRATGTPRGRVLSGVSTGGWAALALQVFYPDFFNGAWISCPDPVDFRAFELVNIYEDTNAFINQYGCERPSDRAISGEVRQTVRREVQLENFLGYGNNWALSGQQWGQWNAAFGPRGADGLPVNIWNADTGLIDHRVAEQWEKYDLRLVMEKNWTTLGPKLQGKLHLSVGDADNYYLNNAVHLLDDFLSKANPPYKGSIVYGPRKGHGWSNLDLSAMLKEMDTAANGPLKK